MLFCHRFVNNFFGNLQKTLCESFSRPRCFTAAGEVFTLIPHVCQQLFSLFPGNLLSGTFRERLFFRRRTRCLRFQPRGVNTSGTFFEKSNSYRGDKGAGAVSWRTPLFVVQESQLLHCLSLHLDFQVMIALHCGHASFTCAFQKSLLDKIWLINVLYGPDVFGTGNGQRL